MNRRTCVSLFLVLFFMCGLPAQNPTTSFLWDANVEDDLAGYWMYRSLTACTFIPPDDPDPAPSDCPQFSRVNTTIIPVDVDPIDYVDQGPLEFQIRYYYRVTAENTFGVESGLSNEVDKLHIPPAPATPTNLRFP